MAIVLSFVYLPDLRATVTPGQLPTYWLEPVKILNVDVLPEFGLPTKANRLLSVIF